MTPSEMIEILEPYRYGGGFFSNRLVQPDEKNPVSGSGEPTGNTVLYTSLACIMLKRLFPKLGSDLMDYAALIYRCYRNGERRGLVCRSPWKKNPGDQVGIDDYTAMVATSELVNKFTLDYGKKHYWYFDAEIGGKFSLNKWFGRYPQWIAQVYWASQKKAPFWTEVWTWFVIGLGMFKRKDNQDGHLLTWLLTESIPARHWLQKQRARWRRSYSKKWPGQEQGIAARVLEPGHPVGQYFIF